MKPMDAHSGQGANRGNSMCQLRGFATPHGAASAALAGAWRCHLKGERHRRRKTLCSCGVAKVKEAVNCRF
jgi:hypothetical protein